jgi:hypothetical protein
MRPKTTKNIFFPLISSFDYSVLIRETQDWLFEALSRADQGKKYTGFEENTQKT